MVIALVIHGIYPSGNQMWLEDPGHQLILTDAKKKTWQLKNQGLGINLKSTKTEIFHDHFFCRLFKQQIATITENKTAEYCGKMVMWPTTIGILKTIVTGHPGYL